MKEQLEESLAQILPVNGYLFSVLIVDENSSNTEKQRAVWIDSSSNDLRVRYNASGWVAKTLRQYIKERLRSDGFEVSRDLLIKNSGDQKNDRPENPIEESQHTSVRDRIDSGDSGDSDSI